MTDGQIQSHLEGQRAMLDMIAAHLRDVIRGQTMIITALEVMPEAIALKVFKAIKKLAEPPRPHEDAGDDADAHAANPCARCGHGLWWHEPRDVRGPLKGQRACAAYPAPVLGEERCSCPEYLAAALGR